MSTLRLVHTSSANAHGADALSLDLLCACVMCCAEYLNERLTKLLDESISTENWLDVATGWETILSLRSEMTAERGQAILDCTSCAQLVAATSHGIAKCLPQSEYLFRLLCLLDFDSFATPHP